MSALGHFQLSCSLDPAEFVQSLYKRGDPLAPGRRRGSAQEPDSRQLARLLRVRGERPCGRASEKRDELSSLQMIEPHMPPLVRGQHRILSPSPVMVLTPVFGEAATTSWPRWSRMATVFEPISPVPPITTIFMFSSERESVSRREARVCAGSFASGGRCTALRSGLSPRDGGRQGRFHDSSAS